MTLGVTYTDDVQRKAVLRQILLHAFVFLRPGSQGEERHSAGVHGIPV